MDAVLLLSLSLRFPQHRAHHPAFTGAAAIAHAFIDNPGRLKQKHLVKFLSPASSSSILGTTSSFPIHRTFRSPSSPTYELQPSIQVSPHPPPSGDFYRHRHRHTKVIPHPDLCGPSTPDCQFEAFASTAF
ncbi:hypothetical protein NMY22_g8275 [Coprinellus aureogranulatus]|nr:hypothetical protein NMY22_g8275 [Coprinellus aureogranulatus]